MNGDIVNLIQKRSCCQAATIEISRLPAREGQFLRRFMPKAKVAIALLHHVTSEEEWTWYAPASGGERCDADDHLRDLCEDIKRRLVSRGHDAELVPYPGKSGLQFRFVAQAAGLGTIGTNAFLFHPSWGPWVHLRVMATSAGLEMKSAESGGELCDRCGLCIAECPAGAISEDDFNGLQCRAYRKAKGEYEPCGPNREYRWCIACALACPKGK